MNDSSFIFLGRENMNHHFLKMAYKVLKKEKPVYYTPKVIVERLQIESIIANPPFDGKR